MSTGKTAENIDEAAFAELRRVRAHEPEEIGRRLAARRRRPLLGSDGRLFIVAADHTARGAMGVGGDPNAMSDRYELLRRLAIALSHPGVDGVLGTPDIIDDLALLGLLDDRVIVGSMNRGGLRGASFEMDDRFNGYTIESISENGLDFAKTLTRVNLNDAGTAKTLAATARAVNAAAQRRIPIMLEPFMSEWRDGRIVNDLSPEAVATSIAIVSALGESSAYTWLKVPAVDGMERVIEATTLPVLLLGGDSNDDPEGTYARWGAALGLPGVCGLTVGRTLLYPPDGDVEAAIDTAARLVHPGLTR